MATGRGGPKVLQGLALEFEDWHDFAQEDLELFRVENVAGDVENGRLLLIRVQVPDWHKLNALDVGAFAKRIEDGMLVQRCLWYPVLAFREGLTYVAKIEDAYWSSRPDSLSRRVSVCCLSSRRFLTCKRSARTAPVSSAGPRQKSGVSCR